MDKELLLKYINGDCTTQEKIDITNWLDSDSENMREYLALRKLNDITIWQTPSVAQPTEESEEMRPLRWWKPAYTEAVKIAAILVLAVFISRFLIPSQYSENQVAMQTLHVPAGQRAELTLEDGTKVWLNAKTTLTFPNRFSGKVREVKLDGEGFFDVTSNKSRPFIVNTEKYNVKVWGTRFNLMAYPGSAKFETSLIEGSVEIIKQGHNKGLMLKPNEQVNIENGNMMIDSIHNMDQFLWMEGIINFDNVTFNELFSELELYFDMKIEMKNNKIANCRCTGKFRAKDGIEHILKVLQIDNEFSYQIDEKSNKIIIE